MGEHAYEMLSFSLANALSIGVRLYQAGALVSFDSTYHLEPDPATLYLEDMLNSPHQAGIITTPLAQHYGFIALPKGYHLILGPTAILEEEPEKLLELTQRLGIPNNESAKFENQLRSAPLIDIERFAWVLVALTTALAEKITIGDVWLQHQPTSNVLKVKKEYVTTQTEADEALSGSRLVQQSYAWEQLVGSYIEEGRPDVVGDLFAAPPKIEAGKMSYNTLRQSKNAGICAAALAARRGIVGGVPVTEALRMSDVYIQKIELLHHYLAVERLIQEMLVDFAATVKALQHQPSQKQPIYTLCENYVLQHLFSAIKVEEMAKEIGYSRAYLCHQFKQQAGITLSQYILREKISASKKVLEFTDKSLSQTAELFGFSSQSHFQTVFKKHTGETPQRFRNRRAYHPTR